MIEAISILKYEENQGTNGPSSEARQCEAHCAKTFTFAQRKSPISAAFEETSP